MFTNSKPMTPAPIKTNLFGTCFKDKAPVELTIDSSSISIPGNGVTLKKKKKV